MKRFLTACAALLLLLACTAPALAAEGKVTYQGDAKKFFFQPGTEYSLTDLFPNFKDVMPGDSLTQHITVRNHTSNRCKVKIYMRSLGAHEDSEEFLSQLHLTVTKVTDTVMFDAAADETAQLTDWIYLGTLYSGGECELLVTLDVPVTLDNRFKNEIGYLDWEFAVEEVPVEPTDPEPPKTGDESNIWLWVCLLAGSLILLILLRKKREE